MKTIDPTLDNYYKTLTIKEAIRFLWDFTFIKLKGISIGFNVNGYNKDDFIKAWEEKYNSKYGLIEVDKNTKQLKSPNWLSNFTGKNDTTLIACMNGYDSDQLNTIELFNMFVIYDKETNGMINKRIK